MSSAPKCCQNCFGDKILERIISDLSSGPGKCDFCGSENAAVVEAIRLREVFVPLINTYEENPNGRLLVEWLRDDWALFTHGAVDMTKAKELLAEILDNGEIVRKKFSPSTKYQSTKVITWETLRTELMHENRYFPSTKLDFDRLDEFFEEYLQVPAQELPTTWFRARLQLGEVAYPLVEMGAPPRRVASHGRANPAGIPYLYLGSTPETAVSEIRPHTGERACVAEFSIPDGLKIIDLRRPRLVMSPFVFTDEDLIGPLRDDVAFLDRLGDELTRPVIPQSAPFDYVPSQYVCEYIKQCGYNGVLYRSSVSTGINLALFNPALATARSVRQYEITRVAADIRPIDG